MISTGIKLFIMESSGTVVCTRQPVIGWKLLDCIELYMADDYSRAIGNSEAEATRDRIVTIAARPDDGDRTIGDVVSDVLTCGYGNPPTLLTWTQSADEVPAGDERGLTWLDLGVLTADALDVARTVAERRAAERRAVEDYDDRVGRRLAPPMSMIG